MTNVCATASFTTFVYITNRLRGWGLLCICYFCYPYPTEALIFFLLRFKLNLLAIGADCCVRNIFNAQTTVILESARGTSDIILVLEELYIIMRGEMF
jgi:hypothetical protein